MTFQQLPRWMRIWIFLALAFVVLGTATCIVLYIVDNKASYDAASQPPPWHDSEPLVQR